MKVYLSFGSNMGNRRKSIQDAIFLLGEHTGIEIEAISNIIETLPYGFYNQANFLNCTLRLNTEISAYRLLGITQTVENKLGRERNFKWGPRNIDIDILLYGDNIIETEDLLIPHPAIRQRTYLLQSLQELCPDLIHPLYKRTIEDLLQIITYRL